MSVKSPRDAGDNKQPQPPPSTHTLTQQKVHVVTMKVIYHPVGDYYT